MKLASITRNKRKCVYKARGCNWTERNAARDWCVEQESEGWFISQLTMSGEWWFELERDALMFSLKWSVRDPLLNITITKTTVNAKARKLKDNWTLGS